MNLLTELRQAARQLRSRPGFTATVVLTLALTIGAATTVFSLFDAVLLRPFPYRDPDRIVRIRTHQPQVPGSTNEVSLYDFEDYQRRSRSFSALAAYTTYSNNLTGDGPARAVRMTFASPELFGILGVQPVLGRSFSPQENVLNGDVRKVILSYALWQDLFRGSPDALNRTIRLRGDSYTVVGVMPQGFGYPNRSEIWVPLLARYSNSTQSWWKRRDSRPHFVLGKLREGVSAEQASSELASIAAQLRTEHPESNRDIHTRVLSLREAETGELRPYALLVGGAVLLLLIIGCVNVANLFVARAAAREREFTIRAALGSGLAPLVRQLLTESLIYGLLGGALGVGAALLGVRALTALIPVELPTWMVLSVDARVIAFAVAITLLTVVLFGVAPVFQNIRPDLNEVLKQGARGSSSGNTLAGFVRRGLVVAEVALSLVLLVGAGLMMRSFAQLMAVDTGVKTERLIVASIGRYLPNADRQQMVTGYSDEFRRVRDRIAQLPGVIAVGAGNDLPYLNKPEERQVSDIYTRQRATRDQAYRGPAQGADVMPGYFAALGIPLLEGRDFTEADTLDKPKVVVIGKHAADTLFPGRSAIGEQIRYGNDQELDPWMTVVGVVSSTQWHPAERRPGVEVYWSYLQYPTPQTHMLVRTAVPPETMLPEVRRVVHQVNPDFAVIATKTMDAVINESVWQRKLWGFVLTAFAGLALLLAAVGLYGVMSYLVSQRTRELGIRLAIGAQPGSVLGLVLGSGMKLVAIGAVAGLAGALALGRLLSGLLFGVSTTDPSTYIGVPVILTAVALLACAVPAIRASRIDPLRALREE
jgi:putative ABC transport system permease protein